MSQRSPLLDSPDPKVPDGKKANVHGKIFEGGMIMKHTFDFVRTLRPQVKTSITVKLPLVNITFAPKIFNISLHN